MHYSIISYTYSCSIGSDCISHNMFRSWKTSSGSWSMRKKWVTIILLSSGRVRYACGTTKSWFANLFSSPVPLFYHLPIYLSSLCSIIQLGKHESIVSNIYDLLAHLAFTFDSAHLDHLFTLFQESWGGSDLNKERLLEFIQRLASDDSEGKMAVKVKRQPKLLLSQATQLPPLMPLFFCGLTLSYRPSSFSGTWRVTPPPHLN